MPRDRIVSTRLRADVSAYLSGMRQAAGATRDFQRQASESARKHKADWDQVGRTTTVAGLAIAAGVGVAVSRFMDFDAAMSAASAATKATATDLQALREAALQAGADTQYSATEAAQAITELGKAGVSTADILGGGLNGALSLAAAGQMEVAKAAELSSVAMKQFGLKGSDLGHVADLLAAGAGKAVGSVEDMGMALKQAGLVASQTGLSIEETTGTLAAFAEAGLIGSDAGTSFKSMLQRLTPQSKEAADLMRELGISAYDAQGQFVGMEKFAGILRTSLSGLTTEQRNSAMATIFGSDAVRAAAVLYENGADGVGKWTKAVNDTGFAADQAARLTDNLRGDLERLGGSFDTALIQAGSGANDALRQMAQLAEGLVNRFSALPAPIQSATVYVGGATAAVALLGGAALMAVPKIKAFETAMVEMGLVSQATATKMMSVAKTAGIVAAAVGTVAVASEGMQQVVNGWQGIDANASKSLDAYLRSGRDAAEVSGLMRSGFYDLGAAVERVFNESAWIKASNAVDAVMFWDGSEAASATAFFGQLDKALSGFVQGGRAQEAADVFRRITDEATKQGIPIERLQQAFPQYTAALAGAAKAGGDLADVGPGSVRVVEEMGDATLNAARQAKAAAEATKLYAQELQGLSAPALDAREAARQWESAIDAAALALKENGRTLDITTDKGRENTKALDEMARAAGVQIAAMQANGATQQQLQGTLEQSRRKLFAVAMQFYGNEKAAWDYVDSVLAIPPARSTTITADTSQATPRINALKDLLDGVRSKTITVNAIVKQSLAHGLDLNAVHSASGGHIKGPGTATSDSIPAWLSNGEYVIKAAAVARYGVAMFDRLNAMHFADGGYVARAAAAPSTGTVVAVLSDQDRSLLRAVAQRPVQASVTLSGGTIAGAVNGYNASRRS